MNILKSRYLTLNSQTINLLTMPKYAVAVGRRIGIYDTFDECKEQILNYPNAKYKKCNTLHEAEEYIRVLGKSNYASNSISSSRIENIMRPNLFKVDRVNQKDATLNCIYQKLSLFEETFNKFATTTVATLEEFNLRLINIENSNLAKPEKRLTEVPAKRIKLEEEPLDFDVDHSFFLRNDNDVVKVYTDGACTNNGQAGAKAGIGVWFNHGHPLNVSSPLRGPATNNNAEIQAARVAITQAANAGLRKLCVHTDSKFLISCISEWIHKWKKNNWKLVNGGDVKNKVEIVKLDIALQALESVEWIHVKGHQGIEGNEMADKLARDGAALYKTNVTFSDYSDV